MKLTIKEQAELIADGLKRGFKYDGCTAVPDFDYGADCCAEHDYYYQDYTLSRAESDKKLRQCIRSKGYIVLPWIYWLGARTFGRRYYRRMQNEALVSDFGPSASNSLRDTGPEDARK